MYARYVALCSALLGAALLLAGTSALAHAASSPTLWINEFMADSDSVVTDEYGEYDDVIELHNAGDAAVDLAGMYLAVHNIYLVHDLDTDLWELVPWDLDGTFSQVYAAIDLGSLEDPEPPGGANILRSRILAVPAFRATYCQRLGEYMDTIFSDQAMYPKVEAIYGQIVLDGQRDGQKLGWESADWLMASPDDIKRFITERKYYLRGEIETFCPTSSSG